MTDLRYRLDGADPTLVNTTGAAAAAIVSTPAGFAVTATSGGGGSDMRLAGSTLYKRSGATALRVTNVNGFATFQRLPFAAGNTRVGVEFYHGADALPSGGTGIVKCQTAAGVGPRLTLTTDGRIALYDAAGGLLAQTAAGAWATGRLNRAAWLIDNTGGAAAGTSTVRVFSGDSTTPTGTLSVTGANLGAAALTNCDYGTPIGAVDGWVEWFEDVQMGDGRTTEFGPYVLSNTPPTVDAGVDQTGVEPYTPVTLTGTASDGDGAVVSVAWTQTAGPAVTLTGTGATRGFVAPGTVAGTTLTFTWTATDNLGATSSDTVTVTVLPVTERVVAAGVEVPMQMLGVASS